MLTDEEIAALTPKSYTYRVTEKDGTPGFGVAVDKSGNKSYFIQYRDENHKARYKRLASVEDMSVDMARQQCAVFRKSLSEPKPAQVDHLIAELVLYYLERLQQENRDWKRATKALARAELFPMYEKMVSEVDSLEPWLAFLADRPSVKRQVMSYLRAATGISA